MALQLSKAIFFSTVTSNKRVWKEINLRSSWSLDWNVVRAFFQSLEKKFIIPEASHEKYNLQLSQYQVRCLIEMRRYIYLRICIHLGFDHLYLNAN